MNSVIYAGLDVHKDSVSLGAITDRGEILLEKRIANNYPKIRNELLRLRGGGEKLFCCYEAGPTGYGLAREINGSKIGKCQVVAPGKLPKKHGNRIKTDRRDALKLARLLALGDISVVSIPDDTDESARELLRYRKIRKDAQKRTKQQLKALLLRHGKQYMGKGSWTKDYIKWVSGIDFGESFLGQVRNGLLHTIEDLENELKDMEKRLELMAQLPRYVSGMEKLRLFRGIGLLTGLAFLLEVGDFNRFATAKNFMAWIGLVPSENSSGETIRRGKITKAGNTYLRTLVIEASWHYAYGGKFRYPKTGADSGLEQEYLEYVRRADRRLLNKMYKISIVQKKSKNIAVTAVARELSGFVWGIMTGHIECT